MDAEANSNQRVESIWTMEMQAHGTVVAIVIFFLFSFWLSSLSNFLIF